MIFVHNDRLRTVHDDIYKPSKLIYSSVHIDRAYHFIRDHFSRIPSYTYISFNWPVFQINCMFFSYFKYQSNEFSSFISNFMVEGLIHYTHTICWYFSGIFFKKWQKIQAVTLLGKLSILKVLQKSYLTPKSRKIFFVILLWVIWFLIGKKVLLCIKLIF